MKKTVFIMACIIMMMTGNTQATAQTNRPTTQETTAQTAGNDDEEQIYQTVMAELHKKLPEIFSNPDADPTTVAKEALATAETACNLPAGTLTANKGMTEAATTMINDVAGMDINAIEGQGISPDDPELKRVNAEIRTLLRGSDGNGELKPDKADIEKVITVIDDSRLDTVLKVLMKNTMRILAAVTALNLN